MFGIRLALNLGWTNPHECALSWNLSLEEGVLLGQAQTWPSPHPISSIMARAGDTFSSKQHIGRLLPARPATPEMCLGLYAALAIPGFRRDHHACP